MSEKNDRQFGLTQLPRLAGRGLVAVYRYILSPLFGPRCRHAEAVCLREPKPALETRPDGHAVRCWRADEIRMQREVQT